MFCFFHSSEVQSEEFIIGCQFLSTETTTIPDRTATLLFPDDPIGIQRCDTAKGGVFQQQRAATNTATTNKRPLDFEGFLAASFHSLRRRAASSFEETANWAGTKYI
jgi:hypothetical protein